MNYTETGIFQKQKVRIKNLLPEIGIEQAQLEIVKGLQASKPYISSKFFYDKTGSELFEQITDLKEYYPTRTEKSILKDIAPDLMNQNSSFEVIELGSGDCSKISILLDAVDKENLGKVKYIPVDFSRSAIQKASKELSRNFPEIEIDGYVADFIHQVNLIPHSEKARIICFLGSTIGNFKQNEAKEIIHNLAEGILENDSLLVGFDLVKSDTVLENAYNDSQGVTEAFNKNILSVVNKMIGADFNTEDFNHLAYFNSEKSRIEMHLLANQDCKIESPFLKQPLSLKKGDSIHTENSHKYALGSVKQLIEGVGLFVKNTFVDPNNWFALVEFGRKE